MMKNILKYTWYSVLFFILTFYFGLSGCNCSALGIGGEPDDPMDNPVVWLAILIGLQDNTVPLCSSDPSNAYPLTAGSTFTYKVPYGKWCFYRMRTPTTGFYDYTLTDPGLTNDPDIYLSYFNTIPLASTSDTTKWVASDTTNVTSTGPANFYGHSSQQRVIGVYGKDSPLDGTGAHIDVDFSLVASRVGDMPVGCSITVENTQPYVVSSSSGSVSVSGATDPTNLYYLLVNNTGDSRNYTIRLNINFSGSEDRAQIGVSSLDNECNTVTPASIVDSTSNTETIQTTYTIKPGDYHLITVQLYEAIGIDGITGNYTLSIL